MPEHLKLYDASGRRVDFRTGGGHKYKRYVLYQLIVLPGDDDDPIDRPIAAKIPIPAELRSYGFIQTVTEVPFDFRDIPMP